MRKKYALYNSLNLFGYKLIRGNNFVKYSDKARWKMFQDNFNILHLLYFQYILESVNKIYKLKEFRSENGRRDKLSNEFEWNTPTYFGYV
jgi:hypothetical protein